MISELVFTVHTRAGKQGLASAHIYALHLGPREGYDHDLPRGHAPRGLDFHRGADRLS